MSATKTDKVDTLVMAKYPQVSYFEKFGLHQIAVSPFFKEIPMPKDIPFMHLTPL